MVPSVAPLAHTNEIRASSSAQRSVSVPVTTRRACAEPGSPFGPGGPAGPCGPCAPGGPAGPGGPCAPGGPAGPCGPSAPPGPAGPCGPSVPPGPAGPCGPCAPGGPAGPCGPSLPPGPAGPCGPDAGWPHPATASVMMRTEILTSRIVRPSGIDGSLPPPSEPSQETDAVVAAGGGHASRLRELLHRACTHVKKDPFASSTSISPQDPTSFVDLKHLVERTFTTLDRISELK